LGWFPQFAITAGLLKSEKNVTPPANRPPRGRLTDRPLRPAKQTLFEPVPTQPARSGAGPPLGQIHAYPTLISIHSPKILIILFLGAQNSLILGFCVKNYRINLILCDYPATLLPLSHAFLNLSFHAHYPLLYCDRDRRAGTRHRPA
jgi:hypothetical protein